LVAGSRYSAHTADERRKIEAARGAVTAALYDGLNPHGRGAQPR
jgi:hypothetical protein